MHTSSTEQQQMEPRPSSLPHCGQQHGQTINLTSLHADDVAKGHAQPSFYRIWLTLSRSPLLIKVIYFFFKYSIFAMVFKCILQTKLPRKTWLDREQSSATNTGILMSEIITLTFSLIINSDVCLLFTFSNNQSPHTTVCVVIPSADLKMQQWWNGTNKTVIINLKSRHSLDK